ncbi:MAG: hypothetical protein LBJ57_07705 [Prevotellaceae bacterium]|jgi:hypothetical protein|nr:hypothetical protein [Prevotellaceae bacterium]
MAGFFKRLRFHLAGGITNTSKYEARCAALEKKYAKYISLKQTPNLLRYQELAIQIATPRRQSGLSKKKWKAMKKEFARLRKSAEVLDFFKLQRSSNSFHEILRWELTFEDTFAGTELNNAKWTPRPALIGAATEIMYSPSDENHLYTNGGNLAVGGNMLKILVKREQASGIGFNDQVGFAPIERKYTSGIVSTAQSHVQQYGKVEAKICFHRLEKGLYHSMWLGTGKRLPHVNVLRIGSKIEFSAFAEKSDGAGERQHVETWKRSLLKQNTPYVVTIEWSKEVMIWKINGVTLFSAPNIVDEPVYIAFSSGVTGNPRLFSPAALEVCWVRGYKPHDVTPA